MDAAAAREVVVAIAGAALIGCGGEREPRDEPPPVVVPVPRSPPASPDAAPPPPLTGEFIQFANRDGPFSLDEEEYPLGAQSRTQGVWFRVHNAGDRSAGAFEFRLRYFEREGRPVPIETKLGSREYDESASISSVDIVEVGQTRDMRFDPNYGPIPPRAAYATIELVRVCEADVTPRSVVRGTCWWP